MIPALVLALAAGLGLLLGHLHFALLRRAVARWLAGDGRGFWLQRVGCTLGSVAALGLVAVLAGPGPLLAAAAGFLITRQWHLRRAARGRP